MTSASSLVGNRLNELNVADYNILVMGVVDPAVGSELIFRTSGVDHRVAVGNILVIIGPDEEIQRFRADIKGDLPDRN